MECDTVLGSIISGKFLINLATKNADLSAIIMAFAENVTFLGKCSWCEKTAMKKCTIGRAPSRSPHILFESCDKRPGMEVLILISTGWEFGGCSIAVLCSRVWDVTLCRWASSSRRFEGSWLISSSRVKQLTREDESNHDPLKLPDPLTQGKGHIP